MVIDQVEVCVEKSHRSILGKVSPVSISLLNIVIRFGLKFFRRFNTPVQIEFAVDDLEYLRVYTGSLAGCRKTPRSISAVLRSKTLRVGSKPVPVFGAGKIPLGIIPLVGKRIAALHRTTFGVIGNRVIAFDGHPEESGVDLIEGHRGTRHKYKDRSDQGGR